MMHGHHNGKLHAVGQYQRDWYAHILWTVYKVCAEFLDQRLSKADLLAGAHLANPFTSFNHEITRLPPYENSGCPTSLQNPTPAWSTPSTNNQNNQKPTGIRTGGLGGPVTRSTSGSGSPNGGGNSGGPATKKQRNSATTTDGQHKENFWRENKSFDITLKTTKQKIEQDHGCTYLSYLLKTGGTSIPETLNNLGLNIKRCGRYTLWGAVATKTAHSHTTTPPCPQNKSEY